MKYQADSVVTLLINPNTDISKLTKGNVRLSPGGAQRECWWLVTPEGAGGSAWRAARGRAVPAGRGAKWRGWGAGGSTDLSY